MTSFERCKTLGIIAVRLVIGVPTALLVLATPSLADTVADFHATFVEPAGGPSTPRPSALLARRVALPTSVGWATVPR